MNGSHPPLTCHYKSKPDLFEVFLSVRPQISLCGNLYLRGLLVDHQSGSAWPRRGKFHETKMGQGRFNQCGFGCSQSWSHFGCSYGQSCLTAVLPCQSSSFYLAEMSACHQRAAEHIVGGAVKNGGIYIKLGQGLCSFNHLLPPEYIRTLQILEDRALNRRYKEVSRATQTRHTVQ